MANTRKLSSTSITVQNYDSLLPKIRNFLTANLLYVEAHYSTQLSPKTKEYSKNAYKNSASSMLRPSKKGFAVFVVEMV